MRWGQQRHILNVTVAVRHFSPHLDSGSFSNSPKVLERVSEEELRVCVVRWLLILAEC